MISRRKFLALSGATAAGYAVRSRGVTLKPVHRAPELRIPLSIPPVLQPTRVDDTTDYYRIVQRSAEVEIIPGTRTTIWGYEGTFPGPTIRSRQGRKTVVHHFNQLGVPTVVHLHGGSTSPESDGFPTDFVMPGDSKLYTYANHHPAATLWYHDHAMDHTGRNIFMGLAGLYIVEDESERNLPLPRDAYDVPLIIQDRLFSEDGSFHFRPDDTEGAVTDTILINGTPRPRFEVKARRYRFRILNASNGKSFRLSLGADLPFVQIATDGGLLPMPIKVKEIPLAMAERVEVVVDFSGHSGSQIFLRDLDRGGVDLLRFDVGRKELDDSAVPEYLTAMSEISRNLAVRERELIIGRGPCYPAVCWSINGREFEANRAIAAPRLDEIEIWRIWNRNTGVLHPVHLHLVKFQILKRNRRPLLRPSISSLPLLHERGWKDTVALQSGEEVELIVKFEGFRGKYVLHCHNLEHEDRGMMARFDVV